MEPVVTLLLDEDAEVRSAAASVIPCMVRWEVLVMRMFRLVARLEVKTNQLTSKGASQLYLQLSHDCGSL